MSFAGEMYRPQLSIVNQGPYVAHARNIALVTGDPALDSLLQDATNPLTVAPDDTFTPKISATMPASVSGDFTVVASYVNVEQHVVALPGAGLNATLSVFAAPTIALTPLSETQTVDTQNNGRVIGGWTVVMQASPMPSEFQPVDFQWMVDGLALTGTSGATATMFLPVGAKGGPFVYQHTIEVTAVDAQGNTASAIYSLIFGQPKGTLNWNIDRSGAIKTQTFHYGTPPDDEWVYITTPSLEDASVNTLQMFAPLAITWTPSPVSTGPTNQSAVYAMNGTPVLVTAAISDAIGQQITLTKQLPGEIITYSYGPGWHPPKLPQASSTPADGNVVRTAAVKDVTAAKLGRVAIGPTLSGEELLHHIVLARKRPKAVVAETTAQNLPAELAGRA